MDIHLRSAEALKHLKYIQTKKYLTCEQMCIKEGYGCILTHTCCEQLTTFPQRVDN